jgi:hypothetical protein
VGLGDGECVRVPRLRPAGLVDVRRDARPRLYRLRAEPFRKLDELLEPYRAELAGVAKHFEVSGHSGLVHADGVDELGHRTLADPDRVENPRRAGSAITSRMANPVGISSIYWTTDICRQI